MNGSPTRVSQALILLGGKPDDIRLDDTGGHLTITLGTAAAISLCGADQAVLDKLATVFAQAAADSRARTLKQVA